RSGGGGRLFGGFRLHRTGILALGVDVAVDKLDHRARRVVAVAEARLHDAGVTAVPLLVARRQHLEELLDLRDVADFGDRLAAGGKIALLAERDELLDDRPQLLRLRQRRHDLLVLDQARGHVGEHRLAVSWLLAKLAVNLAVTHRIDPSLLRVTTVRRTMCRWASCVRPKTPRPRSWLRRIHSQ